MRFLRRGTFLGGAFLPSQKEATFDSPIQDLGVAPRLWVPLAEDSCDAPKPIVEPGERVHRGQRIADPAENGVAVHAPADGTVVRITQVFTTAGIRVPAMEIETDSSTDRSATKPSRAESTSSSPANDLLERSMTHGIVGDEGGVSPCYQPTSLANVLRDAREKRIKHLVINAAESEPYLTAAHRVLVDHTEAVLAGARRAADFLRPARVWLTFDGNDRSLVKRIEQLDRAQGGEHGRIRVRSVANKYPACTPRLLVHTLLGRHVPPGGVCRDVGVCVLGVRTAMAVGRSLLRGEAMTSAVVTVSGELVYRPGNYRINVGTPVSHVLATAGADLNTAHVVVAGGPLTGRALRDPAVVVTKSTTGILVLPAPERATEPTACIRCGWCLDDCPVGLDPLTLMNQADTGGMTMKNLHPETCIGCGICSFVCPSCLPLMPSVLSLRDRALASPISAGPSFDQREHEAG